MRLDHVEGAVLVGGESRRMGRDKAVVELDGVPLAVRAARALEACVSRVRLVARPGAAVDLGYDVIEDRHETRAPIVGIAAALAAAEREAVVVAACDMPYVEPRLVAALLAMVPAHGAGAPIVVPISERGPEPLLAVYRTRLLGEIESRIASGALSLMALVGSVDALHVDASIWRPLDPEGRSFHNINRPDELHG